MISTVPAQFMLLGLAYTNPNGLGDTPPMGWRSVLSGAVLGLSLLSLHGASTVNVYLLVVWGLA